jgi:hypothetical protein
LIRHAFLFFSPAIVGALTIGEQAIQSWQSTFLGIRALPHDLSEFERQAFFSFSGDERRLVEARRTGAQQLGLTPDRIRALFNITNIPDHFGINIFAYRIHIFAQRE